MESLDQSCSIMTRYNIKEHLEIVKICYQNLNSVTATYRTLHKVYGLRIDLIIIQINSYQILIIIGVTKWQKHNDVIGSQIYIPCNIQNTFRKSCPLNIFVRGYKNEQSTEATTKR